MKLGEKMQAYYNDSIATNAANSMVTANNSGSNSTIFLAFGLLLFGIIIVFLVKSVAQNQQWPANESIRLLGIIIIVVLAIFVVIAGIQLGESIITAVIGLLGTLGGYLAGISPQSQNNHEEKPKKENGP